MRHGPPAEAIEVQEIETPRPENGTVGIRVGAASLNFGDIARCRGGVASVMAEPPFTLGMDACGVVEEVGPGAEGWLGQRVVAMTTMSLGGLADVAVAPVTSTFPAPPSLDDAEAVSLLLPAHLGILALHRRAALQAGETLVVLGAASGVGTVLIQLGVAAGAIVIAVAGGPAKVQRAAELGAQHVVDQNGEDVFDRVMSITGGRGADVVCDLVGGPATEVTWAYVAREGRYLPLGFNDDPDSGMTGRPLRKVATGNFTVHGVVLAYLELPAELRRFGLNPWPPEIGPQVHAEVGALVAAGSLQPVIGRRIAMEQVADALEDHSARRTIGRTVVDIEGGRP